MIRTLKPALAVLLTTLVVLPTDAVACRFRGAPDMCSNEAQDAVFWVGEWEGPQLSLRLEMNGVAVTPQHDPYGSMTLFELDGQLGFAGDGVLRGEAELTSVQGEYIDPLDPAWDWLNDDETIDLLDEYGAEYTTDRIINPCGYREWPRWTGTYLHPEGLTMSLTMIGMRVDAMLGRIYYRGPLRDQSVTLDSRFLMRRYSFDTSGWTWLGPNVTEDCQALCMDGLIRGWDDRVAEVTAEDCQNLCTNGEIVFRRPPDRPIAIRPGVWENCPAD